MTSRSEPNHTIYGVTIKVCTDQAFKIEIEGEEDVPRWIPFSVLVEPTEKEVRDAIGDSIDIEIPAWVARQKGLD